MAKGYLYALIFGFFSIMSYAEKPSLLPMPQRIIWSDEVFNFNQNIDIVISENTTDIGDSIHVFFKNNHAIFKKNAKNRIEIGLISNIRHVPINENEGYELTVSKDKILLYATTKTGLFYGFQTLKQLTVKKGIQGCTITDYPAFKMRGFMHDVGRSFISITELKRQIALLSHYKINVFHWHLTEDIAWRLESKIYPQLTPPSHRDSFGAVFSRFQGQFYTQSEAKDLVDFCKKHHVLLIPEMDMPGHSAAFKRAMGVDMQSEEGKKMVKNLLSEWCALFDVPYLHIGTDEVQIKDTTFIPEMIDFIHSKGKEVIGWLPGGKTTKPIIRQMWTSRPRPQKGLKVIDSRNYYLNHFDTMADLVGVFNHNICDTTMGDAEKLGAIACIWNDRKLNTEGDIMLMNGFYPIMLTLAERAWRGGGVLEKTIGIKMQPDFKEYETRLLAHKTLNFNYLPFPYIQQADIKWRIIEPFKNGGDLSKSFPPEQGNLDFPSTEAYGASVYLRHVWGDIVPAYLPNPKDSSTAYAYTYVYAPKAQKVGIWLNFHNYGRSEKDASPSHGAWDYKKSCVWLNGQLIQPPRWKNVGVIPADLETAYADESCEMRLPPSVFLKKGWNFLLLKLPVGAFKTKEYRLVKWFFTAVFVQQKGVTVREVDGLIYATDKNHIERGIK